MTRAGQSGAGRDCGEGIRVVSSTARVDDAVFRAPDAEDVVAGAPAAGVAGAAELVKVVGGACQRGSVAQRIVAFGGRSAAAEAGKRPTDLDAIAAGQRVGRVRAGGDVDDGVVV